MQLSVDSSTGAHADYGLDAPPVVRNLLLAAVAGLGLWDAAGTGLWSGSVRIPIGGDELRVLLAPAGLTAGLACLGMALWMIWSSKFGKLRERERLLGTLAWRGDEEVLDVGCGRGLMLVGAAKRLGTGRAVGVDLWRVEDLGGNSPEAALANAAAEGVGGRVRVETADMCALPFPDASFDVVLSRAAIHNLAAAGSRGRALDEIARVLKPGGTALLADIRHLDEYAAVLQGKGLAVRVEGSAIGRLLLTLLTFGALRPGVLRAQRPAPAGGA